jgi:hypothetical protein
VAILGRQSNEVDALDDQCRRLREGWTRSMVKFVASRSSSAIVLLLVLLGANSAVASVCEAYCAVAMGGNRDHQTEMAGSSSHHHSSSQHHMTGCSVCPKGAGVASPRPPDCANVVLGLQGESRVLSRNDATRQLDVSTSTTKSLAVPINNVRFSTSHAPPSISSSYPLLVPLRI